MKGYGRGDGYELVRIDHKIRTRSWNGEGDKGVRGGAWRHTHEYSKGGVECERNIDKE